MGKFLLVLLLCLTYRSLAGIILVPVSFEQTPNADTTDTTTPSTDTASLSTDSNAQAPDTTSTPTDTATTIYPQAPNPVPSQSATGKSPISDEESTPMDVNSSTTPTSESQPQIRAEDDSQESKDSGVKKNKEVQSSSEDSSSKNKKIFSNSNSFRRVTMGNVRVIKNRRLVSPDFYRSIVLMKEFPEKNAILSNSNINFVEKKFILQNNGTFTLTFTAQVVPSHMTKPLANITLIIDLNGATTELVLPTGRSTQSVSLAGQEGGNSLIFSLSGNISDLGLVSVVLTQFKIQ